MANVFVDSNAVGGDTGIDWANAFATLEQGIAATGAGEIAFISHLHNQNTNLIISLAGTGQLVISVNAAGSVPPVAADVLRGAQVRATQAAVDIVYTGFAYYHGINFIAADDIRFSSVDGVSFEDVWFNNTGPNDVISTQLGMVTMFNCNIVNGATAVRIQDTGGRMLWRGGAVTAPMDVLEYLFGNLGCIHEFEGFDLSLVDTLVNLSGSKAELILKGCPLKAGFAISNGTWGSGHFVGLYGSHSSINLPYFIQEQTINGVVITETTNVKTGGSSDGTTSISLKFITSAEALQGVRPLKNRIPILFYASAIGEQELEIEVMVDGVPLKNDEAWLETSVPGITMQRDISDSLPVNPLTVPADLPLSAAIWDTTGIAVPVKQTISLVVDVKQVGWVEGHICFARPSEVMYADLKVLDGQRQYLAGQAYINGEAIPPPEPPLPVINEYIMPMVAELVRDQIVLIMSTELPKQKAIAEDLAANEPATQAGQQAQKDLDNKIFDIINNIYAEKGTHFNRDEMPGINIYFGRSDYSASDGSNINEQISDSTFTIEVHLFYKSEQENDAIEHGDEKSARQVARILGILRGILMSGQYITLGDSLSGIVWRRRVTGLDVFQPDFQAQEGMQGLVGILNIAVKFREIGPELLGEILTAALTDISIKLRLADDGKVISIES